MKLGYVTICWGKTHSFGMGIVGHPVGITNIKDLCYVTNGSIEEAIHDLASAGYQGFELFDGDLMSYADRKDELRALMEETGLEMAGVYTGANLIYPDIVPEELWKIDRVCALSSEFGCENLVVGAGARRSTGTTDEDYDLLGEGLDEVTDVAAKHGLTAHYHPHLTTMVETPEELERVMSRSKIDFCPDIAHLAAGGGDPVLAARKYADRIKYVHLKDFRADPFAFLPLGQGEVDMAGVVAALNENGYNGWVTVELDSYDGPAREGAEISKAFLEALYELHPFPHLRTFGDYG